MTAIAGVLASSSVDDADRFVEAENDFARRFPTFDRDGTFARWRKREYSRLEETGHVYLDYTGASIPAASQIAAHRDHLDSEVFGNPHSNNPTSQATTRFVVEARDAVLAWFNAPSDEYCCVFTPNATGALRLVGESYPFEPGGLFAPTVDNHNSVNGIREYARHSGAMTIYIPITSPDLRIDASALTDVLSVADRTKRNLLAYPAQSNFSGVQHSLGTIDEAHERGWDVLLDAAAFAPTNRLDLTQHRPDFVSVSMYKIIGYPTGIGCLIARRDRLHTLTRPWFSGGTITVASVEAGSHYLRPDEGAFEDGTVNFLDIPAVTSGLRHLDSVGLDKIHTRVTFLTHWLLDAMTELRHRNGRFVIGIYGPTDSYRRGGTIAFHVLDRNNRPVRERCVEARASHANISLRTGCFCNPGASEATHHLGPEHLNEWFGRERAVTADELRDGLEERYDRVVSNVRVSLGVATNFADVYRFVRFLETFVDSDATELADA
jgi:molybdenum cofactor sulfurtransferase